MATGQGEVVAESDKLQENDGHYSVTVPKKIVEKKGLKGGDLVNWVMFNSEDDPDVRFLENSD